MESREGMDAIDGQLFLSQVKRWNQTQYPVERRRVYDGNGEEL